MLKYLTIYLIFVSLTLQAEPTQQKAQPIDLTPILTKLEPYLGGMKNMQLLGLSGIHQTSQRSAQHGDTWLSEVIIQRDKKGIFQIPHRPSAQPFFAPASTDLALQVTVDLSTLPTLIKTYQKTNPPPITCPPLLENKIANISLEQLFQTATPATLHLCIDFDTHKTLSLGKESIGRPHFAIRIDGVNDTLEQVIQHYITIRGALFTKQQTSSGTLYTLPKYFSDAIAGYLPVIEINTSTHSTTIASDHAMLRRLHDTQKPLHTDHQFKKTWRDLPRTSSAKLYVSKRSLQGLQHFYQLALKEKWFSHPLFTQNKHFISAALAQLNSAESGIALSLSSEQTTDTLTLKSPLPTSFLTWFFKHP